MELFLQAKTEFNQSIFTDLQSDTNGQSVTLKHPLESVRGVAYKACSFPMTDNTVEAHNRYITWDTYAGVIKTTVTTDLGLPGKYTRLQIATGLSNAMTATDPNGSWVWIFDPIKQRYQYTITGQTKIIINWADPKHSSLAWHLGIQQKTHTLISGQTVFGHLTRTNDGHPPRQVILAIPELAYESIANINEQMDLQVFTCFYIPDVTTNQYVNAPNNMLTYYYLKAINIRKLTPTFYIWEGNIIRLLNFGGNPWYLQFIFYYTEITEKNKMVRQML